MSPTAAAEVILSPPTIVPDDVENDRIAGLQGALDVWRSAFHAIVDKSADGVVVVNAKGTICFVNAAAQALLGRDMEELLGEAFGIPVVHGDTTEIELLRQGMPDRTAEIRVVSTVWQGHSAYLATLRDVTDRKRIEEEARSAVRQRDNFLAMLSHELRNPLAAIVNASQLLEVADLDVESQSLARKVIHRQCRQMTRLLDDLLDVARVTRGRITLRCDRLDLRTIATEAVTAVDGLISEHGHELSVELPKSPVAVDGDAARLQQVIVNLLSNAARYTQPQGMIELSIVSRDGYSILRVKDNGIGMSPEVQSKIFEPFVQIDNKIDRPAGGLGVGLALARSLVELHGGQISVSSAGPGQGTTFEVRLKLAEPTPQPLYCSSSEKPGVLRILVVEDNADVRDMLQKLLELDDHIVLTAESGTTAIELIEAQLPDVALIDIGLPGLDGYEVARRVKANPALAGVYLVALTGYGQPADCQRALVAGFDVHLAKPIDMKRLNDVLAARESGSHSVS